jgi:hypothetical protein
MPDIVMRAAGRSLIAGPPRRWNLSLEIVPWPDRKEPTSYGIHMTESADRILTPITQMTDWLRALLLRKPRKLVAVALANKMARVAWAIMTRGGA